MSTTLGELKSAVSELSVTDRAELVQFALALPDESTVRDEWKAVAARRLEEMTDGRVSAVPLDRVFRPRGV